MHSSSSEFPQTTSLPALYLDFGADGQRCEKGALEVSERGMGFVSRWRFEIGSVLELICVKARPSLEPLRLPLEGMVVECAPLPEDPGAHRTSVFFLDLPEALRDGVREVSFELAGRR